MKLRLSVTNPNGTTTELAGSADFDAMPEPGDIVATASALYKRTGAPPVWEQQGAGFIPSIELVAVAAGGSLAREHAKIGKLRPTG